MYKLLHETFYVYSSNLVVVSEVTHPRYFVRDVHTKVFPQPLSVTPEKIPLLLSVKV